MYMYICMYVRKRDLESGKWVLCWAVQQLKGIHPVHLSDMEFYRIFRPHLVCVVGINSAQPEKIALLT